MDQEKNSSEMLVISKIIILFGYSYIGFKIAYLLIQFYYNKVFVLRSSFNWTISISNWIAGGIIINSIYGSFDTNILMGVGCILAGFIHLPRFIKLDNDSITIYDAKNKQIKYKDLINIDYKDKILSFDTDLANYNLKMISVNLNKIDKIRDVIKNSDGDLQIICPV